MSDDLTTSIQVKLDKLQQNFADAVKLADDGVKKIEESFSKANPDASGMIKSFLTSAEGPAKEAGTQIGGIVAGAIAASAAGVAAALISTIDALSAIGDKAQELRLPVNLLQGLRVAADEARVPTEKLNEALDEFTKVSKQNEDEAGKFYKALGNIGDQFVDNFKAATTQADRLKVLSDAFKSTTDEVKRAQLAEQAFGTDNERVIQVLGQGGAALDLYVQKATALGLKIDEGLVKQSQEARSEIMLLSRVLTDQLSSSLSQLIPLVTAVIGPLGSAFGAIRDVLSILASDTGKPTSALQSEMDGLVDEWVRLKNAKDALQSGTVGPHDGLRDQLRSIINGVTGIDLSSDVNADIKTLDDQITQVNERIQTIKKLIASRNAESAGAGSPPAFQPRPSLSDDSDKKDAFTREEDTLKRRIANYNSETETIGQNTAAKQQNYAVGQLIAAAERAGRDDIDKNTDSVKKLSAAYGDAAQRAATATQAFQQQQELIRFGGDQIISIMDGIRNKTLTAQQAVLQLANAFINAAEKAILLGSGPLAGLFGTAAPAGSGGTGGLLGSLFGGTRASGGPVEAGKAYLVNENTPNSEIFVPSVGGSIIPPHAIAGGGNSGGGLSQNITVKNYGQDVSTQRNSNGDLEITVRAMVRDEMSSPRTNGINASKYGIQPTVRRYG